MKLASAAMMIRPRCLPDSIIARKVSISEFSHSLDPERSFILPEKLKHWSLTLPREKLVKIGAKVIRHGRYVTFQMAEAAVPRDLFQEVLRMIDGLRRSPPVPA